jgi:hypothetical protein
MILLAFFLLGQRLKIPVWLLLIGQGLLAFLLRPAALTLALLDYQFLAYTLFFFLAVFWKKITWYKFALIGLVLGGLIATRYPIPIIFPYLVIFVWWVWANKDKIRWHFLLFTVLTAGIVYLLSYWFYFAAGHNLLDWVRFEIHRFNWWVGDRPLRWWLIWQVLFTGSYYTWWGEGWHTDNDWNVVWPSVFVASTVLGVWLSWEKLKQGLKFILSSEIIMLWVFSVMIMGLYTFGSGMAIRYLLLIAPFWYLTIAYFVAKMISKAKPELKKQQVKN